jgi:hypothetical protein
MARHEAALKNLDGHDSTQGRRLRVLVNALPCPGRRGSTLVFDIARWAGQDDRIDLHALIREDQIAACEMLSPAVRLHVLDRRCSVAATRLLLRILIRQMSADVLLSPPDFGAILAGCKVSWLWTTGPGLAALAGAALKLSDITRCPAHEWVDGSLSHLHL